MQARRVLRSSSGTLARRQVRNSSYRIWWPPGDYAAYDADDDEHERCLSLIEEHPGPVVIPVLVVTEVAYFLETMLGVETEIRFLGDLAAGELIPLDAEPADWLRIAELVARYSDLPLGTVDASVVVAAERLEAPAIATLDRRHFSVVRPSHRHTLELLP